jgi:hypothetical protein
VALLEVRVFDGSVKGTTCGSTQTCSFITANNISFSKDYEYFEIAIELPQHYESLKLRLQIEDFRLLDYGEAAGIPESSELFSKKMKVNETTVMALLSDTRSLLGA